MQMAFLDRDLGCKCGQMSWAMMYGKAEFLTSHATSGNHHSQQLKWKQAFHVYHQLPTIGAEMTERLEM